MLYADINVYVGLNMSFVLVMMLRRKDLLNMYPKERTKVDDQVENDLTNFKLKKLEG